MKKIHSILIKEHNRLNEAKKMAKTPKGGWHTEYKDVYDNPVQSNHRVKAVNGAGLKWIDYKGRIVGFSRTKPGFVMMNDKNQVYSDAKAGTVDLQPSAWGSKDVVDYMIPYYAFKFDEKWRWLDVYTGNMGADLDKAHLNEELSNDQIAQIEKYADRLFSALNMDVEFGRHFKERLNDPRNQKDITSAEMIRIFRETYKKYGKKIAQWGTDAQAVVKDMVADLNMPFMLKWDDRNQELDLVPKTVMRKKDFHTPNTVLTI